MNNRRNGIALNGGSSLLVIFAVLCLTVFAMLMLSTVKADLRLADALTKSVQEYYKADCMAEEILAQLRAGIVPEGVEKAGTCYAYTCPVSDTQVLCVVVDVTGDEYRIKQWKLVAAGQWNPEQYVEVWNPEMEEE